jgi:hypothetical protein
LKLSSFDASRTILGQFPVKLLIINYQRVTNTRNHPEVADAGKSVKKSKRAGVSLHSWRRVLGHDDG